MAKLAIKGGAPVRPKDRLFPAYNPIGKEEKEAAVRVIEHGTLSGYLGSWDPAFLGGPEVQTFEKEWAAKFGAKHAIAMNSATSCLIASMGAIGIEPGDEVVVTPYSMCISATAPLFYGGVPIFADIEKDYLCLDPHAVENAITPRTKAILVVDLFSSSHDADAINAIAKKHDLRVVADSAQIPGSKYKGRYAGTLSDIGVYSFNVHKNIHMGEGGMAVTNDDRLAERLQLIRNHAESVVKGKGVEDISNLVGQNLRLTEIQAAMGREQLKKLDGLNAKRRENATYIAERCQDMPGFYPAPIRPETEPIFHHQPFFYDENVVGVARSKFVEAVRAELPATATRENHGPLIYSGYQILHMLPLFQKKIAFGEKGYPFVSSLYDGSPNYDKGICPIAEHLFESRFIGNELLHHPQMSREDIDDVIKALHKVYENRAELA